jgi:hypothetical protein
MPIAASTLGITTMPDRFSDSSSVGFSDDVVMGDSPYISHPIQHFAILIGSDIQDRERLGAPRSNSNRSTQEHDPHYYPDQVPQIPYEEIASSCKLSLEGITDVSSSIATFRQPLLFETICLTSCNPETARSCRRWSSPPETYLTRKY